MADFVCQNATAHYDPSFARKLGITAAVVLSRIIWSLRYKIERNETQYFIGDKWWMWNTIKEFCEYSGMSKDSFLTAKNKLETAKLIFVEKLDSKTLDRTNHYTLNIIELFTQFPHTNPNFGRRPTVEGGEPLPSKVENPHYRGSGIPTIEGGESLPSKVEVPDNVTKSPSKNPSESPSENQTHIKRGEESAPEVADPPPDNLIQISDLKREEELQAEFDAIYQWIEDSVGDKSLDEERKKKSLRMEEVYQECKLLRSKTIKNQPPVHQKELLERWYDYGSKSVPGTIYEIERYRKAIDEILNTGKYRQNELNSIFKFLESGLDPLISERFLFPWQWNMKWKKNEELTFLDAAFVSMNKKNRKRK